MTMDDPAERARLADQLGAQGYNKALEQHIKDTTVATVNGHAIRTVKTRFGQLYAVGLTGKAFLKLEDAKGFAEKTPPAPSAA